MAVTLTKIGGPTVVPGEGVHYKFSVLMDDSFAAGGEPIDLTTYLGYFYGGECEGFDAIADAVYAVHIVGPGRATATTSSNVLIQFLQLPAIADAGEAAQALEEATSVNLSTIGAMIIDVWGKDAIKTSWA